MPKSSISLGKFILRVPPELHERLKDGARRAGYSLNGYCARILTSGCAEPDSRPTGADAAFVRELVTRAKNVLGDTLTGVVIHGSWARGEAGDASDIDVMLIVDTGVAVTRSMLARWDGQPMTHEHRPVEAHIVSLPGPAHPVSGIWAELSIDGIVVFERDFRVSRVLAHARSEIAEGRLQRRHSHGQNYWIHTKDEVA
ncbi:toxin-antitoxin system HicB family antitoxin [bacterium]|nr:toxin-antitoxin system HicB family antitoxin [bacterium]